MGCLFAMRWASGATASLLSQYRKYQYHAKADCFDLPFREELSRVWLLGPTPSVEECQDRARKAGKAEYIRVRRANEKRANNRAIAALVVPSAVNEKDAEATLPSYCRERWEQLRPVDTSALLGPAAVDDGSATRARAQTDDVTTTANVEEETDLSAPPAPCTVAVNVVESDCRNERASIDASPAAEVFVEEPVAIEMDDDGEVVAEVMDQHEDEGVAEVGVTSCVSPQARAARAAAAASLSGSISSDVTVLPSVADSVKRRESREQVRKYDKEWAGVAEDPQPKRAKTSGCGRRVKPKRRGLRLRTPIARQSACVRTQRGTVNVPRYLKTDGTWMEPMRRREPPTLELDEHSIVHGYGGGGGDVTGARRSGMRSKLWYDKEKKYEGTIKKAHRKVKTMVGDMGEESFRGAVVAEARRGGRPAMSIGGPPCKGMAGAHARQAHTTTRTHALTHPAPPNPTATLP